MNLPLKKFTLIMKINRVPVYAHWSLVLVWAVILIGALEKPAETLAAWCAYFSVILIHECGHMVAAQRLRYEVIEIRLYPIHGSTHFQDPWSRYDRALIAWGGVAAQAVVAIPLVAWTSTFGFTPWAAANVAIGILGYFSIFLIVVNLIPVPQLDGGKAWNLIPEWINRKVQRPVKRKVGWRGW